MKTAQKNNIPVTEIRNVAYLPIIQNNILKTVNTITEVGGFDFGLVVIKYYEGYINDDENLRRNALKLDIPQVLTMPFRGLLSTKLCLP